MPCFLLVGGGFSLILYGAKFFAKRNGLSGPLSRDRRYYPFPSAAIGLIAQYPAIHENMGAIGIVIHPSAMGGSAVRPRRQLEAGKLNCKQEASNCKQTICIPFKMAPCSILVYFLSSLRARTAKTLICTKSGVSADSRKSAKKYAKPHFLCTFYTFWCSFWDRRKPHFLCRSMF